MHIVYRRLRDLYVIIRPGVEMPVARRLRGRSGAERLFDVGDASLYRLPHLDPEVPDGPFRLPLPAPGARPFGLPP